MTKPEATRRIILSRQTFHGWRRTPPAGRIEETLRLISEEVLILDKIAAEFPEKAGTLGLLVQDWKAMAEGLRMKTN